MATHAVQSNRMCQGGICSGQGRAHQDPTACSNNGILQKVFCSESLFRRGSALSTRYWRSFASSRGLGRDGYFSLGGLVLVFLVCSSLAILLSIHSVQKQITSQLKLDSCTGYFALKARPLLNSLIASHERLDVARASTIAACATVAGCPYAEKIFMSYLKVESHFQKLLEIRWKFLGLEWLALSPKNCPNTFGAFREPFPALPLRTVGTDISELARFSSPRDPISLRFSLTRLFQKSTSEIKEEGSGLKTAWVE